MNKKTLPYLFSMFCALYAADTSAAIRVGNLSRSYADAYNTVNTYNDAVNNPTTTTGTNATDVLPVRVANANLAAKIARGDTSVTTTVADLNSCAMVYPDGTFAWDRPTVGRNAGGDMTCVAEIEIRAINLKGTDGKDAVLGHAYLAAGDAFKCNISDFPKETYTTYAGQIEFPADAEPTMDDVIQVMNDEQKKNAGLKIAAGTVIGGLMGNFVGKNDPGHDGVLGTDQGKIKGTAIGALSGAALMAGNTYAGKVAGDTILSTGVNAVAGSAVGNMVASGNQVMRIEDCVLPDGSTSTCLWGTLQLGKSITDTTDTKISGQNYYYDIDNDRAISCTLNNTDCKTVYLVNIAIDGYTSLDQAIQEKFVKVTQGFVDKYRLNEDQEIKADNGGTWVRITSASTSDKQILAMVAGVPDRAFGMTRDKWIEWRRNNQNAKIYGRRNDGTAFELTDQNTGKLTYSLAQFNPMYQRADDGALIDYTNRARTKSTVIGAGAGAGLGALSGYQGAQGEVQERWVTEVRQYQDSLQKIYCATGNRFLGYYNSDIVIPTVSNNN